MKLDGLGSFEGMRVLDFEMKPAILIDDDGLFGWVGVGEKMMREIRERRGYLRWMKKRGENCGLDFGVRIKIG